MSRSIQDFYNHTDFSESYISPDDVDRYILPVYDLICETYKVGYEDFDEYCARFSATHKHFVADPVSMMICSLECGKLLDYIGGNNTIIGDVETTNRTLIKAFMRAWKKLHGQIERRID